MELGAILRVEGHRHLTRGDDPATNVIVEEGHDESWERQPALDTVFDEVLILVALQPLDGLIGSTQLHAERLRPSEEIAVLIGQRGCSAQVAGSVRPFRLETDGRGLVGLNQYARVEQRRVRHRLEADVGIPYGSQSPEVVIRVLQVAGRIGLARFEEGVLFEHMPSQVDGRVAWRTALISDVPDVVVRVQRVLSVSGVIRVEYQLHVHRLLFVVPVGFIGDELLMETEVAAILKIGGDLLSLTVQRVHTEPVAYSDLRPLVLQQSGYHRVVDLLVEIAHVVRIFRMQHVVGSHLLALLVDEQLYIRVEIALVVESQPQVVAGLPRQQRVVDHWCLTHAPQRAVDPRAVLACHRIQAQRQLYGREPTGIAFLTDIALQLRGVDVLIFPIGHHPRLVEHIRVLWQITRSRATRQQQCTCQQYGVWSDKPFLHFICKITNLFVFLHRN